MSPEPVGCFIDYDTVQRASVGARKSPQYRVRPKDTGCLHEHCDYPGEREVERGLPDTVEVVCFGCGMRWLVVPEVVAGSARKERG